MERKNMFIEENMSSYVDAIRGRMKTPIAVVGGAIT